MALTSLVNLPILASKSTGRKYSVNARNSSQASIHEKFYTPQSSIQHHRPSSDSDSTFTGSTLTEGSDDDDFVSVSSRRHVRFELRKSSIATHVVFENNEAEFFTVIPPEDTALDDIEVRKASIPKAIRKRDRIRSVFNKRVRQTNSDSSDANSHDWDEMLAKTLVSMHRDIHEIITGLDELTDPVVDNSTSNSPEPVITAPRLSFLERQRAKIEVMKMAHMLSPPNLLTYDMKISPYPYTDIVEPANFNSLCKMKNLPTEHLLVQHKPFRHKKFWYRTQRGLLKMKRDFRRLKRDIYGERTIRSYKELPSLDVQNYRHRLEKTLLDVRHQIAEYDRIHAVKNNSRQSISQIVATMKLLDPALEAQIEDYRLKVRRMDFIDKKHKNDLISAPFIPRRARYQSNNTKKPKVDESIDPRFDPASFVDLNEEAEKFFGFDKPFWSRPFTARLSVIVETTKQRSNSFVLPEHTGVWARFIADFKSKQKSLRRAKRKASNLIDNGDEFFDCPTALLQQRKSEFLTLPDNKPLPISFNGDGIVHF